MIPSAQTTFTFLPAREDAKMVRAEGITSAGDTCRTVCISEVPETRFIVHVYLSTLRRYKIQHVTKKGRWVVLTSEHWAWYVLIIIRDY